MKWVEDRSEAFVATIHGRDILGYVDLAAKRDGTVLGLKLRLIADIGAYNMLLTAAIPTLTMMMANATYNIPAIRADAHRSLHQQDADRCLSRRRPPRSDLLRRARDGHARARAENGSGRTAAQELHQAASVSLRDANGRRLRLGRLREGARPGAEDSAVGPAESRTRRRARAGPAGRPGAGDVCRGLRPRPVLVASDRRVGTFAGDHRARRPDQRDHRRSPHGQGNETTFAQMLADQFGVPIEHVTILHGDTGDREAGHWHLWQPIAGGREEPRCMLAGDKVKKKMAKFAAALFEAHEDDLVFENGTISVKGSPASAKPFAAVASYA